jgi:hypothetical protein
MRATSPILTAFLVTFLASACGDSDAGAKDAGASDSGFVEIEIDRERSLVWIDPAIVDDPAIVGLSRVMSAVAEDGHGGEHLVTWFNRFASTSHSERLGPALLIEELIATHGADSSSWVLDALPFKVTAVHNRIDLGLRGEDCGQLRVSFASTHPIYAPLHLIFLFTQAPDADDFGDEGLHCLATARRWADFSTLSDAEFVPAAAAMLTRTLIAENFLLAESVELTVSPWEWRQWDRFDNPLLFQTVDTPQLNRSGPLRDEFVQWAEDNAALLQARDIEIPERFRARSARVPPGVARERLQLEVSGYPGLAEEIEIMGCPSCHTEEADFVHTTPQRTFSDFYDAELDARAAWLESFRRGETEGLPPFGPLQAR